jgi:ParB family chromosome partitioning protein
LNLGENDMREQLTKWFNFSVKEPANALVIQELPVDLIMTNPLQPRTVFDDDKLEELASTIQSHGLIQPIVVRRKLDRFELIAGERRLRAAIKLGFSTIPAVIRDMNDSQAASMALVENLQREGLTAIEEAFAYQHFLADYHFTQETLAQRLGKSQSTIANKLRLLHLTNEVQSAVIHRQISERHARTLLGLSEDDQRILLEEIIKKGLTVKQTEQRVHSFKSRPIINVPTRQRFISKDARLAINTIRESLRMIEESGFTVDKQEIEDNEFYEFIIRVPKSRK